MQATDLVFRVDEIPTDVLDVNCLATVFDQLRTRSLEMALLCHPDIHSIATSWDRLLGRHQLVLQSRLAKLGITAPPDEFVQYLLACLGSYNARRNSSDSISQSAEYAVLETYEKRNNSKEIRCECCGYHFREDDINSRRLAISEECGLISSDFIDPRRSEDSLKPISSPGSKDRYYTRLELDHVIPQSSLGWGSDDNIRVLCRFCNAGKDCYVKPLEPYSAILANSLAATYRDVTAIGRTMVTTVSTIRSHGRTCSFCNVSKDIELTVCFRDSPSRSRWFVPWNLRVSCYDCLPAS